MDYLSFIQDISKIWTEKENAKISKKYSLNRAVLPALIHLNNEWQIVFDIECKNYDNLELELNHYKSNPNLVEQVELSKIIDNRDKVIFDNQKEIDKKDLEIRKLKKQIDFLSQKVDYLSNQTLLEKVFG